MEDEKEPGAYPNVNTCEQGTMNDPSETSSRSINQPASPTREKTAMKWHWVIFLAVVMLAVALLLIITPMELIYPQSTLIPSQKRLDISPSAHAPTNAQSSPASREANPTPNWITYVDANNGFAITYPNAWSQVILPDVSGGKLAQVAFTPQLREPLSENAVGYLPGFEIRVAKIGCTNSTEYAQAEINRYLSNKNLYPELEIRTLRIGNIEGYIADNGLPGQEGNPVVGGMPEAVLFACPLKIHALFNYTGAENDRQLFEQILSTLKVWTPKKLYPG